jgi:50S ribosomal protein L16 3-hydroxylase
MYQLCFSLDQFLETYWQKKPTIIKQGFQQFVDPLSPDELAGLTLEEEVDSRFVSNINGQWIAEHGPFSEEKFAELPETNWSLIVQAANHWHQGAAQLVEPFKGLPNWLFDDVMISFSTKDGGVGPHIDQYDVFIIQGMGRRHWSVGDKDVGQYTETNLSSGLRQIESFDPIIEDVLEPGDILYIPPGFPHCGYALEPSLSYSMGYRSPTEQELVSNFADYVLAHDVGNEHWQQPNLSKQARYGEISASALDELTEMLTSTSDNPDMVGDFMGCMLSQSRHQLNIVPTEQPWNPQELAEYLQAGNDLTKVSGLRVLFHQNDRSKVFINGEVFAVSPSMVACVNSMSDKEVLAIEDTSIDDEVLKLLCTLMNKGYWFAD